METIVEIEGLAVKIDIEPIDGILIDMLTKSKIEVLIEVSKTVVAKIEESKIVVLSAKEHKIVEHTISIVDVYNLGAEEDGSFILVDEVEVTYVNDLLSYVGVKSDWKFEVPIVVTIKLVEVVFEIDVAIGLLGE